MAVAEEGPQSTTWLLESSDTRKWCNSVGQIA